MAILLGSLSGGMQPSAPTIGTATAGDTSASVAFTASSYIGKGTITYTATSSPGGLTATGASSPITVTGLTNGTAYTFTVVGNTNYGVASVASAASNSITPATQSSYESISTVTVGSNVSSITFSSIPATYTHLQVRIMARNAATGGTTQNLNMTINNDSGANYTFHQLNSDGANAGSYGEGFGRTNCVQVVHIPTSTAASGIFGVGIIDILDYTNTNKLRTIKSLRGQDQNNTDGSVALLSYLYNSTTAVSRLDFSGSGGDIVQYSSFALYGIKGA